MPQHLKARHRGFSIERLATENRHKCVIVVVDVLSIVKYVGLTCFPTSSPPSRFCSLSFSSITNGHTCTVSAKKKSLADVLANRIIYTSLFLFETIKKNNDDNNVNDD